MFALLLSLLLASPSEAVHIVTADPLDRETLLTIVHRESRGLRLRRHKADERPPGWEGNGSLAAHWVGARAWSKAVQVGDLEPHRCPFHDRGDARDWSTRGAFGHVAAYAMPYLPCSPPWVLDVPIVSAWVAVLRLRVARPARPAGSATVGRYPKQPIGCTTGTRDVAWPREHRALPLRGPRHRPGPAPRTALARC